ncbi:hypothetical protein VroAM7_50970 (plasmid) [Vibrio rotiferianus]|uniref:Putative Flp pilus-assembly TadG-like N-terminal domain-containing protein n=1 Tax=Vibrio rotiferianus TaxID=190895 RepID=A0A510IF89_9VIBR|nr:TadE/TadG family type IV pilus assembly protein [Vibrio rotiferianus]BBL92444.1 hypothetical protein VroAM7_50970 [Vibrio rotiferianus]
MEMGLFRVRRKQKGLTLVVMTLAMVLFIAVGAFSVDVSHFVVNKTRLQNALDSAALAGASVAKSIKEESFTQSAIIESYKKVISASGNEEIALADSDDGSSLNSLTIQYSTTPNGGFSGTFPSSTTDPIFVRVQVVDLSLTSYFLDVFNVSKNVSASSVAGPASVASTANILPIGMCEGDEAGPSGYSPGTVYELKTGSQSDDPNGLGAGNYHLLDMGSGKSAVSDALVGKNTVVVTIEEKIDSETGNAVGATKSIDSRFTGETLDGVYYPKDLIVTEPSPAITTDNIDDYNSSNDPGKWTYDDYVYDTKQCLKDPNCLDPLASKWRRVLPVPILDCDSASKSGGKIEFTVTSIGCFFMIQRYDSSQANGKKGQQSIFGEFVDHCSVVEGGLSNTDTGVDRIVLFKDPSSVGGS